MWTVGDTFKNKTSDVPAELLTFDDYADQIMKDVRNVFDKVKETKLFNGNKGFRKTLTEKFSKRSETPNTRNQLNISTVLPKLR